MMIQVTQLDIDTGTPDDNEDCAIARAIKRALPSGTFVRVELNGEPADIDVITPPGNAFVQIRKSYAFVATWYKLRLPVEVAAFIRTYDDIGPEACAPLSFELAFSL